MGSILGGLANMGVGTATMFGVFDPNSPQYRNLGKEVGNYYNQQPAILGADRQYLGQYANLYNQVGAEGLLGPSGSVNQYMAGLGGVQGANNQAAASQFGTQMGLYGAGLQQANAYARQANPGYWQDLENLKGQATSDLALGSNLDPNEQRKIMQNYYAGSPMHGAGGSYDQMGAAINAYLGGNQLRQQRISNAQNIYGQYGSNLPQMAAPNVNQTPSSMQMMSTLFGQSNQGTQYGSGQLGTPFNSYMQDLYNTNMGANWDFEKYKSELHRQGANQTAQGGAQFTGGMMGACWVAREVFGENNPKWLMFREWLMTKAPAWFRKLYLKHGEAFAGWIRNKPILKGFIARWMERKIYAMGI